MKAKGFDDFNQLTPFKMAHRHDDLAETVFLPDGTMMEAIPVSIICCCPRCAERVVYLGGLNMPFRWLCPRCSWIGANRR